MTSEQLTRIHTARPFEPFRIHLADGRQFDVEHPEFLAYRGGRIATVFSTPEYAEFVDLLLVTSVELTGGTSKRRKRQ
jgi:hypothetical protein